MLVADEILKLKELLDNKIITKEEFEKKKQELLNGEADSIQKNNYNSKTSSKKEKKQKKSSGFSILILIILLSFIGFGVLVIEPDSNRTINNMNEVEGFVSSYDTFSAILKECGFNGYTIKRDELLEDLETENSQGFRIKQGNINAIVYVKDGSVYSVKYSDNYLYRNNKVEHTLSEYTITENEKIDLVYKSKETINSILKSPSTAKYPLSDEWKVGKENGNTIVQGYVDSQNDFGATIRSTFQITYKYDTVVSLIFDGQEYIK